MGEYLWNKSPYFMAVIVIAAWAATAYTFIHFLEKYW